MKAETSDGSVRLLIQDEGPGLDPQLEGRLFDPFVTGRDTGTGLGLALVKRVAEDHGGTVTLADLHGGGTEAILSLPIDGKAGT